MWYILRKFFFLFDAEKAHYLSMDLFSLALKIPIISFLLKKSFESTNTHNPIIVDGISYKNKIGLAAGFDKDGKWLDLLSYLGFGSIEVGTVTPLPQSGNDKPRLFRLKKDEGIINRMGFNNSGVDSLIENLKQFKNKNQVVIGGNIGKNKLTSQENAIQDYIICFEKLFNYVDYFVVNVSSPNTPNLRALQDKEPLTNLLSSIQKSNLKNQKPKPIYLKIAPDLSAEMLNDIIEVVSSTGIQGIIATNTTISRPNFLVEKNISEQQGGLSGAPLKDLSCGILNRLVHPKKFTIINVGGIMNEKDAQQRLNSGADLIQLYAGMIYRGPWFVKKILNSIKG
ncbi:MAG: quinone-dependent dihydroorotate dehydrogenase [Saprospiraceae bacterium]|nr:quinone-dependent dihydroorotate dehydrogenase [Saprospiraceae bacterium]